MKKDEKKTAPAQEEITMDEVELADEVKPEQNTETEPTETELLNKKVEELQNKCDEYLEGIKRAQADFINYKRRNELAKSESYDEGIRDTLKALLPVIDNLERAIAHAEQAGESGGMVDGVKMTLTQLTESFGKLGLTEIEAAGKPFDPELHNAVMTVTEGEPGCVYEVLQKGYTAKGKVIRYSMVKVTAE